MTLRETIFRAISGLLDKHDHPADASSSSSSSSGISPSFSDGSDLSQRILDSAPIGIAITDMSGRFIQINDKYSAILGYSLEELQHLTYPELTPEKWHAQEAANIEDLISGTFHGSPFEKEYIRKDGSIVPVSVTGWLIHDAEGRPDKIGAFIEDISSRKMAESSLKEETQRHQAILAALPDMIFMFDSEGTFLEYEGNREGLYSQPEDFLGKNVVEVLPPALARLTMEKICETRFNGSSLYGYDLGINGDKRYFESRMVQCGEDRFLAVVRDITLNKILQEQLTMSEERYKNLLDTMAEGFFIGDEAYRCIFANNRLIEMLGCTIDDVIGQTPFTFIHPDDVPVVMEQINRRKGGEAIESYEVRLKTKDGAFIPVLVSPNALYDEEENFKGSYHVITDISALKFAQEALEQSEIKFRALAETTAAITFIHEGGKILFINQAAEDVLGYSVDELLTMNFWDGIRSDYKDIVRERGQKRQKGEETTSRYMLPIMTKDGRERWLDMTAKHIEYDGQPAVLGTAFDITDRVHAEQELRKSEQKYRAMVDNIAEGLYEVDLGGHFTFVSDSLCVMLGYTREELLGLGYKAYTHPDNFVQVNKTFSTVYNTGKPVKAAKWRLQRKDGKVLDIETSTTIACDAEGNASGFTGAVRDMTEINALEERTRKAEAMESLGNLAGGVAHDLNNLLGPLVGYPDLIMSTMDDDDPNKRYVQQMSDAAMRLKAEVGDLLSLSRRGKNYEMQSLNLNQLITTFLGGITYKENCTSYYNTGLDLADGLMNVNGSCFHLERILANLAINAFDAMPKGGTIKFSTRNVYVDDSFSRLGRLEKGEYVELSVSDTGTGIKEQDLPKIFEPHFSKKTLGGRSGSGLGLAVVYFIVLDHKGEITVDSKEEQGTTFRMYFPASRDAIENIVDNSSSVMNGTESILIIDDDPVQRDVAKNMLEQLGYQVYTAHDYDSALGMARSSSPDLLVLDMMLEDSKDGYDVYKAIKELDPGQKAIIASGFSETDSVRKTKELGAGEFISKPFTITELATAVRKELDRF